MLRFVVLRIGAVIPDLRIREDDDLPGVARVRKDFLVAGERRIKNDFALGLAARAVTFAAEDPAVFQRKDCLHLRSQVRIFRILSASAHASPGETLHATTHTAGAPS